MVDGPSPPNGHHAGLSNLSIAELAQQLKVLRINLRQDIKDDICFLLNERGSLLPPPAPPDPPLPGDRGVAGNCAPVAPASPLGLPVCLGQDSWTAVSQGGLPHAIAAENTSSSQGSTRKAVAFQDTDSEADSDGPEEREDRCAIRRASTFTVKTEFCGRAPVLKRSATLTVLGSASHVEKNKPVLARQSSTQSFGRQKTNRSNLSASGVDKAKNILLRGLEHTEEDAREGDNDPYNDYSTIRTMCDVVVSAAIVANGICFGFQADYMADHLTDDMPGIFTILEGFFLVVFCTELIVRICTERSSFFSVANPKIKWNMFDSLVVFFQILDIFFEAAQVGFVYLMRIFRLLRILRLVRLLQFLGDLNVVAAAIIASLKFLVSTCLMMLLLIYIVGIVFCQVVTSYRMEHSDSPQNEELVYWWGSLTRSMLSLFEAVCGGCDWDSLVRPLSEVSPLFVLLFVMYIAFTVFAIMNVITGIFVDSAIRQTVQIKDLMFSRHLKASFEAEDDEGNPLHLISRDIFFQTMFHGSIRGYLRDAGLDMYDVAALFDLLDTDHSGYVSSQNLVHGIVRMRSSTKFLDVMALVSQIEALSEGLKIELQSAVS
eukprot:TRINITY_DN12934_c0_g2_i1.p1 TRINITY_DN12934_c0_g2~~TRINITY_DN12934_c0_g2_i1.p1  ORF type:complete len:602 (-),score=91.16 TRINITY_DN12934_c0_g2_i1:389-2194(-)